MEINLNHMWKLLGILILLTGCSNGLRQIDKVDFEQDAKQAVKGDGFSNYFDFIPDTTIGKISLLSPENVDFFLGEGIMEKLVDNGTPNYSVISGDSSQRLTVYFHPGSEANAFSEFEVAHVKRLDKGEIALPENIFATESGIKLGITHEALISIKGEPHDIFEGDIVVFKYAIQNLSNSQFLRRYNMPAYFAEYTFEKGLLSKFRFGFEYP